MSLAIGATAVAAMNAQGANAKGTVTITGCLQGPIPADEYALSFEPNAQAGNPDATLTTFRLTNVTTKATPASARYVVVGTEKQLAAHAGHQVEIAGTLLKTEQASGTTSAEPAVRVESVRMISAKCSERR